MAPVPFIHPVRYPPLILAAGHLSAVVYLAYTVGISLYTSLKALGPASNTRFRIEQRKKFVPIFLGLAVTTFSIATYYDIKFATLSYNTWAYEHGLDLTQRLFGEDEKVFPDSQDSGRLYIAHWLSDTPIYYDALEIVAEKARRFWWGQQIDLGTTAFSLMLATDGRRHRVPLLTAFLALAHLVNLSFAQNLYFLALLLTPYPLSSTKGDESLPLSTWSRLRDKLAPPKPSGWVPNVTLLYAAMALNLGLSFILPYAAGTSTFTTIALLARASTFLPIVLPKFAPVSWGSVQRGGHGAYEPLTKLFKYLSTAALAMYAKTTFVALLSNAPDSHYHRHSALLPWDVHERSAWERSTNAVGKVLGSTSDHPVVAAVGWDVLFCGLSLGLWAAVRGINARDMLNASILSYKPSPSSLNKPALENEKPQDDRSSVDADEAESNYDHEHDNEEYKTPTRRRGNTKKAHAPSEEPTTPTTPSSRRRGRPRRTPRRVVADDSDETPSPPHETVAKSSKGAEAEDDKAYVPTPATATSALEGDEPLPADSDWESASLAWGLAALGGLASASAGVFGGECVSR
ncbi:hypothetical protein F4777DRAFT_363342 [Nemania sp. FL0916]|nr:hypothetical protein F4777DRAFT_363342 [Nemania sp. FL0916]